MYQVINAYVKGQGQLLGNYGIINDSSKSNFATNGGTKTLYVNYNPPREGSNVPSVSFVGKYGQATQSIYIPAPTALAVAEVFKKIFDLYIKLEIDEYPQIAAQFRGNGNSGNFKQQSSIPQTNNNSGAGPSEGFVSFSASNDDAPF